MPLTPSVPNPNKRSRWLLGKPLCRLYPCNIPSRLPSSQPCSTLCCCLTHSSRGLFPCPELFLPPAREMNQRLALPVNARELLLPCQLGREERAACAPSPPRRPPTLPHLTLHHLKSLIHPFPSLPDSFSPSEPARKPRQLRSCPGNMRTNPSQTRRWSQHFTFQSGGSWAPNPRAGNILSLKEKKRNIWVDLHTHDAGLHGSCYGLPVLPVAQQQQGKHQLRSQLQFSLPPG